MAFGVVKQNVSDSSNKKEIDYEAYNKYMVEAVGVPDRESLQGVISVIADLGLQEQEDSEVVFTGDEDDEIEAIKAKPLTYFKDGKDPKTGKTVRLKCWPNAVAQAAAIAVDFPQIIVDKGIWFGDSSSPLPLRIWLGGKFYTQEHGMVLQRMTNLRVNEKLKDGWSLNQKNLFYKLATASKLISAGQPFLPERIDELLGKQFNFTTSVSLKPSADGKKNYLQEYCVFAGAIARGQQQLETDVKPALIQFDVENDPDDVRIIPAHVVATMRRASNFTGSTLEKQLVEVKGAFKERENVSSDEPPVEEKAPAAKPTKPKVTKPAKAEESNPFDDMDGDIPF